MSKYQTFPLALLLFLADNLYGQKVVGYVRDSLGEAIVFASVVATSCGDDRVLAFTNCDDKGRYELVVNPGCDSIAITARGMGYRHLAMQYRTNNLPAELNFTLSSAILQPVLVRGKTPPVIISHKDTTEYNVASFSDSTEVSVEDLLKKLPGIRISENGSITYNGKTVERVMIEGDDLFSQNYTLATRNIRADLIAKVQLIDRFQENPMVKGIQESDRMVMNLKIKSSRKTNISGSAQLGSGYGADFIGRVHTNLFSLSRKNKAYLIGNVNNSGENALSDVEWTASGGFKSAVQQQSLQDNPLQIRDIIQGVPLETGGLPPNYTQTNRSGLLYLGLVLPGSPVFKTKLSAWVAKTDLRQASGSYTRYLIGKEIFDNSESRIAQKSNSGYTIQLESEYFPSNKNHAFRSFVKMWSKPGEDMVDLLRKQTGAQPFYVSSKINSRALDIFGSLEYTLALSNIAVFQLVSKTSWHRAYHTLLPRYDWYADYFGLDSSFTQLTQRTVQHQGKSIFMGRWLLRTGAVRWVAETGLDWTLGRLGSEVTVTNDAGLQWKPDDAYQDAFRIQPSRYFSNISALKTFGPLQIQAGLNAGYIPIRSGYTASSSIKSRLWGAEPRLNVRYTLSEYASLSGYYGFQQALPDFPDLYPARIFADYQTVIRGVPNLTFMAQHQAGVLYRYNERIRQFSWNMGGNMTQGDNLLGTKYQINPFLTIQEKFRPVRSIAYSASGAAEHYVRKFSSRFAIGFKLNVLKETTKVNSDVPGDVTQHIYGGNFSYGSAFDTWINGTLTSNVSWSVSNNISTNTNTTSTRWFSTAQITFKPDKAFHLKIFVHQVANRVGIQPYLLSYAADGVATLNLPRWHSSVELSAVNLLGRRRYEQVLSDAFSYANNSLTAVPGYFLLSWEMSF